MNQELLKRGILASALAVQFGSVSHLAHTFSVVEGVENSFVGWVLALGVEIALAFTAIGHKELQRSRDAGKRRQLVKYLYGFSLINLYGNYYFGITKMGVFEASISRWLPVEHLNHITSIAFAATLPAISLSLIDVYAVISRKVELENAPARTPKPKPEKKPKPKKEETKQEPEPDRDVISLEDNKQTIKKN